MIAHTFRSPAATLSAVGWGRVTVSAEFGVAVSRLAVSTMAITGRRGLSAMVEPRRVEALVETGVQ